MIFTTCLSVSSETSDAALWLLRLVAWLSGNCPSSTPGVLGCVYQSKSETLDGVENESGFKPEAAWPCHDSCILTQQKLGSGVWKSSFPGLGLHVIRFSGETNTACYRGAGDAEGTQRSGCFRSIVALHCLLLWGPSVMISSLAKCTLSIHGYLRNADFPLPMQSYNQRPCSSV